MINSKSKNSDEYKKEVLKNRAEILSRSLKDQENKIDTIEIVLFQLDKENFALETKYVKEIIPLREYTFLPCAPIFMYGITNVRRRILPIINIKIFFSLPDDPKAEKKLVIMENEEVAFALLIDGFSGIRRLSKNELQATLPTLTGIRQEFLEGIIADGTVILNGQKLLTSTHLVMDANI